MLNPLHPLYGHLSITHSALPPLASCPVRTSICLNESWNGNKDWVRGQWASGEVVTAQVFTVISSGRLCPNLTFYPPQLIVVALGYWS